MNLAIPWPLDLAVLGSKYDDRRAVAERILCAALFACIRLHVERWRGSRSARTG